MKRRMFLGSLATVGTVGTLGGCLGLGDANPNVTLDEPDHEYNSSTAPYRAWSQRIPDVTVPAPVESRTISIRNVDTPTLFTFFFSHCQTVCPALVSALRSVQTDALNNGYGDSITFLPITFDPARDDAKRLRAYAKKMNINRDAGNWHFLRPKSEASAKKIIQEQFGVMFEKTKQNDETPGYMFAHTPLIILANTDGYVERAYRTRAPPQKEIIKDLKQLR